MEDTANEITEITSIQDNKTVTKMSKEMAEEDAQMMRSTGHGQQGKMKDDDQVRTVEKDNDEETNGRKPKRTMSIGDGNGAPLGCALGDGIGQRGVNLPDLCMNHDWY